MRWKNKKIFWLLCLWGVVGCGFNTGGRSLADLDEGSLTQQYYQNSGASMTVRLTRNTDFGAYKYSRIDLFMAVPPSLPDNASQLPDFTYALRIDEFDSTNPAIKEDDLQIESSEPANSDPQNIKDSSAGITPNETSLITFGDLSQASRFLYPQQEDRKGRIAVTNLQPRNGDWFVPILVRAALRNSDNENISDTLFTIQNALGGCALFCSGPTAILPNVNKFNPEAISYSMLLWFYDSASPAPKRRDLSTKQFLFTPGYIDEKGLFRPFSSHFPPLVVDFSIKETYVDYKKRMRKAQDALQGPESSHSPNGPLDKFFQSLTGDLGK